MLTINERDSGSKRPRTFIIPQQTPEHFALTDTTTSAVEHFTGSQQQFLLAAKTDSDSTQPFKIVSTQNKFQNNFPKENPNNQFQ